MYSSLIMMYMYDKEEGLSKLNGYFVLLEHGVRSTRDPLRMPRPEGRAEEGQPD